MTHQYEPRSDPRSMGPLASHRIPSPDKFIPVIRNDGGTIDSVDIWGRRRLAYEINKKTEGIWRRRAMDRERIGNGRVFDRQLKLQEDNAHVTWRATREEAIAQVAEAAKLRSREGSSARCCAAQSSLLVLLPQRCHTRPSILGEGGSHRGGCPRESEGSTEGRGLRQLIPPPTQR